DTRRSVDPPDGSRFRRQPERLPYKSLGRQERGKRPASAFANSKSEFTIEQEQMNGVPAAIGSGDCTKVEKRKCYVANWPPDDGQVREDFCRRPPRSCRQRYNPLPRA